MAVFVRARSSGAPPGFGKVIAGQGTRATVEYFHSPTDPPTLLAFDASALEGKEVPPQTRAYWLDGRTGVWRVGRIIDGEGESIAVRFPNGDDKILPARDVYIRWDRPIADPTPYLAQLVCETPLLADARSNFVGALVAQRCACLGMSGLISSAIELESHQVEVVRRVLQDPVQRYLLADEVGLGKTIEAGILIRQYAIDDPDQHKVVVLVPPALIEQWRHELKRRFFLNCNGPDGRILVTSTADAAQDPALMAGAGMLVIDEAHHLSANAPLYEAVLDASRNVPRLLLLSATPVLRNEMGFLEMLHLLDPAVYSLEGVDSFRRKIEHRQAIAEAVAALVPENLLQLDGFLDALERQFPDDAELVLRIAALRAILDGLPSQDDQAFVQVLSEVRGHLSEIYRLDRRILRNRRASVTGLTPERDGATILRYQSPRTGLLAEAVERWRSEAANVIYGREDSVSSREIANWHAQLVGTLLAQDLHSLRRLLTAPPPGSPPVEALAVAVSQMSDDDSRERTLLQALKELAPGTKCVLFCTTASIADKVGRFLGAHLKDTVARSGHPDRETALQRFMEQPECRVLICDRTDEEGFNLQGGEKTVIHYDLPLAPNRIEQRIGRLDRYGSGDSIPSYVLCCSDQPYEESWSACLAEGLGVFDRSIASLQYLVDAEMQHLLPKLLIEGDNAIREMTRRLGGETGEVRRELRRIDQQDALDALGTTTEDKLDELFVVDQDWKNLQEKVDRWLVGCLQMSSLPGPSVGNLPPGDRVSRFALEREGRNPTLIPLDRFVETMLNALDKDAPGASYRRPITYAYTCRRQTALNRWGRAAGVRLLRYGDVLLEGLQAVTSLDDRGRCFAVWRHLSTHKVADIADPFLRFDFVVEVNTDPAVDVFNKAIPETARTAQPALRRRGDMLFPPFFHRLWLDRTLQPVTDTCLLKRLEAPYEKRATNGYSDTNLNPMRLDALRALALPVLDDWPAFVSRARTAAESFLFEREEVTERAREAVARARGIDTARFASLRMRTARSEGPAADADRVRLDIEERAATALYEGIRRPRITLDTVGVMLLSDVSYSDYTRSPAVMEDV
jgi:ATP-dependent helicase HepA